MSQCLTNFSSSSFWFITLACSTVTPHDQYFAAQGCKPIGRANPSRSPDKKEAIRVSYFQTTPFSIKISEVCDSWLVQDTACTSWQNGKILIYAVRWWACSWTLYIYIYIGWFISSSLRFIAIITIDTNIDVEHVEYPLGVDLVFLRKPWGFPPLFVYPRSSSSSRRLRFLIKCSLALRPKKGLKPPEIDHGELPWDTRSVSYATLGGAAILGFWTCWFANRHPKLGRRKMYFPPKKRAGNPWKVSRHPNSHRIIYPLVN